MGLFSGITGAIGGLLSTGSPFGAIAGGLSGLFGGDGERQASYAIRPLSAAQQNVASQANTQIGSLMASLSPEARDIMAKRLGGDFSRILSKAAQRSFDKQQGRVLSTMARTGGILGSTAASQLGELAQQRGTALGQAGLQGQMMGEQVAGQRYQQNLGAAMGLGGLINQTYQGQGVGQVTQSMPGSGLQSSIAGIGEALTNPNSFFSQNKQSFGWWSSPLFGKGKSQGSPLSRNQQLAVGERYQMIPEVQEPSRWQGPLQNPGGAPTGLMGGF